MQKMRIIFSLIAMACLISGCSTTTTQTVVVKQKIASEPGQPSPTNVVVATPAAATNPVVKNANVLTPEMMRALARRISDGDRAAFGELRDIAQNLYRDIDFEREKDRAMSNLVLMRAAFVELGERAGNGGTNAFTALKLSLGVPELRGVVPEALGIAAADGRTEALAMLLNYQQWGILKSSAVFALCAPAEKNNQVAVDFLAGILADPDDRALWQVASQGLAAAANQGNLKAKTALEKYAAANQKFRTGLAQ